MEVQLKLVVSETKLQTSDLLMQDFLSVATMYPVAHVSHFVAWVPSVHASQFATLHSEKFNHICIAYNLLIVHYYLTIWDNR